MTFFVRIVDVVYNFFWRRFLRLVVVDWNMIRVDWSDWLLVIMVAVVVWKWIKPRDVHWIKWHDVDASLVFPNITRGESAFSVLIFELAIVAFALGDAEVA